MTDQSYRKLRVVVVSTVETAMSIVAWREKVTGIRMGSAKADNRGEKWARPRHHWFLFDFHWCLARRHRPLREYRYYQRCRADAAPVWVDSTMTFDEPRNAVVNVVWYLCADIRRRLKIDTAKYEQRQNVGSGSNEMELGDEFKRDKWIVNFFNTVSHDCERKAFCLRSGETRGRTLGQLIDDLPTNR